MPPILPGVSQAPSTGLDGSSQLDQPPPSPDLEPQSIRSLAGLAPPRELTPPGQAPPDVVQGLTQALDSILDVIHGGARVEPQFAADYGVAAAIIGRIQKKRKTLVGARPLSPTEPGRNFPGGGFSRGVS